MTRKQKIAKFILDNPKATYKQWVEFQNSTPEIRLKKAGKDKTLINLEGKSGFTDPESWLNNYKAGQKINLMSALETSHGLFTKDEMLEIISRFVPTISTDQELVDKYSILDKRITSAVDGLIDNRVPANRETMLKIAWFLKTGKMARDIDELKRLINE